MMSVSQHSVSQVVFEHQVAVDEEDNLPSSCWLRGSLPVNANLQDHVTAGDNLSGKGHKGGIPAQNKYKVGFKHTSNGLKHEQADSTPAKAGYHTSPSSDSYNKMAGIRASVIGRGQLMMTPFGQTLLTYADYTASGRLLDTFETYLRENVYPWYANVHTDVSTCGSQTNSFFTEARELIAECVHAPSSDYSVIFTGNGMTGAVHKLAHLLGVQANGTTFDRRQPVIYVSHMEHHSNEVFWREMNCNLVAIPPNDDGVPDLKILEFMLKINQSACIQVGCFSAGSNVTGIFTDVHRIASLLHANGAIAAFDYAAAGSCADIRCTAQKSKRNGKVWQDGVHDRIAGLDGAKTWGADLDAVLLSPHKLPGGPGSCGVLVIRRDIVQTMKPHIGGGGTVLMVTPDKHAFLSNLEAREEAGTPNVLAALRAAMALELKSIVGQASIHAHDLSAVRTAIKAWEACPGIALLGASSPVFHSDNRSGIISFHVMATGTQSWTKGALLHPHFVAALLNDVYGIQARSGCSCAGPYGVALMGEVFSQRCGQPLALSNIIDTVAQDVEWIKPGWCRVNFNYMLSEAEAAYMVHAILDIAANGWKLLPFYVMETERGTFRHKDADSVPPPHALSLRAAMHGIATSNLRAAPPVDRAPGSAVKVASQRIQSELDAALAQSKSIPSQRARQLGSSTDQKIAAILELQKEHATLIYADAMHSTAHKQTGSVHDHTSVQGIRQSAQGGVCRDAASIIRCPERWFVLPHEAEAAIQNGKNLAVLSFDKRVEQGDTGDIMTRYINKDDEVVHSPSKGFNTLILDTDGSDLPCEPEVPETGERAGYTRSHGAVSQVAPRLVNHSEHIVSPRGVISRSASSEMRDSCSSALEPMTPGQSAYSSFRTMQMATIPGSFSVSPSTVVPDELPEPESSVSEEVPVVSKKLRKPKMKSRLKKSLARTFAKVYSKPVKQETH